MASCDFLPVDASIGEDGHLRFAGMDSVALAKRYGTPLMLLDEERIRSHCRAYKNAMERFLPAGSFPLYASKALAFKEIYRIVASEKLGTDVVSPGELATAVAAGFPMDRVYFHGNNKTDDDIRFALERGVGVFIVDNVEELKALSNAALQAGITQRILLRITPGIDPHTHKKITTGRVDSKFGSAIETGAAEAITQTALALPNVKLCGFHCHIGSQIFDVQPFVDAAEIMVGFMAAMRDRLGFTAKTLNLGGGFGVRYTKDDPELSISQNIQELGDHLRQCCERAALPAPRVLLEPGRSLVADAGITLYRVGSVKEIPGFRNYISIDGGMTDNPRYTLYQSKYEMRLANRANENANFTCSVGGRCCESGDLLGEGLHIAKPKRGDLLAVFVTGAYTYAMASNYNRICRPPIVMIKDGKDRVVVRRETYDDLMACDL